MTQVKCLSRGSSASIKIEEFASLIPIEDDIEVSVTEENASANEPVRLFASAFLDLAGHLLCHWEAAELVKQLVIIDTLVTSCLNFEG